MQLYYDIEVHPEEDEVILYISELPDRINDVTSEELEAAVNDVLDSSGLEVDKHIMENAHLVIGGKAKVAELKAHLTKAGCKPVTFAPGIGGG